MGTIAALARSAALSLVFAPVVGAQVWVVDPGGGGDFTGVQQAINALPEGSTILVEPGDYPHLALSKRMKILGALGGPRPRFADHSRVINTGGVTLAGLEFETLALRQLDARTTVEDCVITGEVVELFSFYGGLEVDRCDAVTVARSVIHGSANTFFVDSAVSVRDSTVHFSECEVVGLDAPEALLGQCGRDGGVGMLVYSESRVSAAACDISGGDGSPPSPSRTCGGKGAAALSVFSSTVDVRDSTLLAGVDDAFAVGPQPSAVMLTGASLSLSGTTAEADAVDSSIVSSIDPLPVARLVAPVQPGETALLELTGPDGLIGWLGVASGGGIASIAPYEGPVWVADELRALIPFVTPATIERPVPALPSLAGISLSVQAAYPNLSSPLAPAAAVLGTPEQIVIRL